MKVAVVGNGNVGLAVFRELQNLRQISEIVLVGRKAGKLKADVIIYGAAQALYRGAP